MLSYMALPYIRREVSHNIFYISHILRSFLLIPAIYFHVPYTRKYIYQGLLLYIVNGLSRKLGTITSPSPFVVAFVPGSTGRLSVSIPLAKPPPGSPTPTWIPGQHVYLKAGESPHLPKSPFTILSVPLTFSGASVQHTQNFYGSQPLPNSEFVLRHRGGPTSNWLEGFANEKTTTQHKEPGMTPTVLVEGPYGTSTLVSLLLATFSRTAANRAEINKVSGETVLLVAGGIGATYTLPIYVSLLQALIHNPSLDRRIKSKSGIGYIFTG